jgi:hypothetical protein
MAQRATMLMTSHWRIPQIFATQSMRRLLLTSWQLADCYCDGYASRRLAQTLALSSTCLLHIPSWLPDGRKVNGWLGERSLLGENKLAALRNAQQVFLSLMEYGDFPGPLHEVSRGDPLALRTRYRCCGRLVTGSWCLCHIALHLPRHSVSVL